ncbi:MAG: hypothetical protein R3F59_11265 [Myxococcota bacterium]
MFLLDGDVVAATSADDERQVVHMLLALDEIDEATAARITADLEGGSDAYQGLMGVGEVLDQVLAERFRQNLADYLGSASAPRFLDQRALFVTNIQMGHDTRRLIDELCLQNDVAKAISSDMVVVRGRTDPGKDPRRLRIASSVGVTPVTVASVLDGLAMEPLRARVLVGELLATGVLVPAPPSAVAAAVSASAETEVEVDFEPSEDQYTPYVDEDTQSADGPPRTSAAGTARRGPPPPPEPPRARERVVTAQSARTSPSPARTPAPPKREARPTSRTPARPAAPPATPPATPPSTPGRIDSGAFPKARPVDSRPPSLAREAVRRATPAAASPGPAPRASDVELEGFEDRDTSPPSSLRDLPTPPAHVGSAAGTTLLPLGEDDDEPSGSRPRFRRLVQNLDDDEDVEDARTEQVDPNVYARQSRATRGLTQWLNRTEEEIAEEDSDISIFSDHDYTRGAGGAGTYGTRRHHLDVVDLDDGPEGEWPEGEGPDGAGHVEDVGMVVDEGTDEDEEMYVEAEVIEANEAPVSRYGAPVLSTSDAVGKVDVTNEVLAVIAAAFDDAEGPGRGRAVLQLMVDGVPSQSAVVLHDLRVGETGELDSARVLRNLEVRPATEHRQLLNTSLTDLIERALSAAADELPDDRFDEVLASVAGYRQRMGW